LQWLFCFMFLAHLELILMTVVCNFQKEFTSCKISPVYSSFLFRLITFKKTDNHSVCSTFVSVVRLYLFSVYQEFSLFLISATVCLLWMFSPLSFIIIWLFKFNFHNCWEHSLLLISAFRKVLFSSIVFYFTRMLHLWRTCPYHHTV